jgi:hypothetical protein
VHRDHVIPILLTHAIDDVIPEDAGVVDDDVKVAEVLNGRVHEAPSPLETRHVVGACDGLTPDSCYFVDNELSRGRIISCSIRRNPNVVDDDLRTMRCKLERMLATQASACPRYDRYSTLAQQHDDS